MDFYAVAYVEQMYDSLVDGVLSRAQMTIIQELAGDHKYKLFGHFTVGSI